MVEIPRSHPRYRSLIERERIVKGLAKGIVVPEGLLAHGRGEALDYLLGEETTPVARKAIRAAAALLLASERPVISVNGNAAALVGEELVRLSKTMGAPLEVNLFYRSAERVRRIRDYLLSLGAEEVLTPKDDVAEVLGLESERRFVSRRGIYSADTVLVMLEDGDRTEKLVAMGKKVIAVDLNPLSRTARAATVTIVDNVTRCIPLLTDEITALKGKPRSELEAIVRGFDNDRNLRESLALIAARLARLSGYEEPLSD
jgi:4-phosphopantoate--beta-alanine ligase